MQSVSDLLSGIEDGNAAFNPARGLQGPIGNFSGCLRRSAQQLLDQLFQQVTNAVELRAPARVVQALMPAATTTLNVETSTLLLADGSTPTRICSNLPKAVPFPCGHRGGHTGVVSLLSHFARAMTVALDELTTVTLPR
jgi:hypothetical protein